MNLVVLVGRLAQDPEMRVTKNGHNVCNFGVAVDRRAGADGQREADFFNVVAWNRQAELICQYLTKGRQIAIQGRLQNRSYQAQDGSTRRVTEIMLDSFDFIGSRNDAAPGQFQGFGQPGQRPEPLSIDDDFSLMEDGDDIPF